MKKIPLSDESTSIIEGLDVNVKDLETQATWTLRVHREFLS